MEQNPTGAGVLKPEVSKCSVMKTEAAFQADKKKRSHVAQAERTIYAKTKRGKESGVGGKASNSEKVNES